MSSATCVAMHSCFFFRILHIDIRLHYKSERWKIGGLKKREDEEVKQEGLEMDEEGAKNMKKKKKKRRRRRKMRRSRWLKRENVYFWRVNKKWCLMTSSKREERALTAQDERQTKGQFMNGKRSSPTRTKNASRFGSAIRYTSSSFGD